MCRKGSESEGKLLKKTEVCGEIFGKGLKSGV